VLYFESLVDFDDILHGGGDAEDDIGSLLFNPIPSNIPRWRTFKLMTWVPLFNRLLNLDEISHGDDDTEVDLDSLLLNPVAYTIQNGGRSNFCGSCNRLVDLNEILYGGDDSEDDIDFIVFNLVASTIQELRTFKLLWCVLF
jgi:hypothetical protein